MELTTRRKCKICEITFAIGGMVSFFRDVLDDYPIFWACDECCKLPSRQAYEENREEEVLEENALIIRYEEMSGSILERWRASAIRQGDLFDKGNL